jgi:hypothetical protein
MSALRLSEKKLLHGAFANAVFHGKEDFPSLRQRGKKGKINKSNDGCTPCRLCFDSKNKHIKKIYKINFLVISV